jgi:eukaryotic translation initiation factor 2C
MPVVNVGTPQMPSYLPVDVCTVLPGQPSNTKLTPSQTQQMIKFAVRKPIQNAQSIVASGPRLLGLQSSENTTLVGRSHYQRIICCQLTSLG